MLGGHDAGWPRPRCWRASRSGGSARPEEVADLAVYLLSERSAFVTGSVHAIDGGYSEG